MALQQLRYTTKHCKSFTRLLSISIVRHDSNPVVAAKQPLMVYLEAGKKISWCSCGLSKKQPFCDGSHKTTKMRPVRYTPSETCESYFCCCKQTKSAPFCDGSHMSDRVRNSEIGKTLL